MAGLAAHAATRILSSLHQKPLTIRVLTLDRIWSSWEDRAARTAWLLRPASNSPKRPQMQAPRQAAKGPHDRSLGRSRMGREPGRGMQGSARSQICKQRQRDETHVPKHGIRHLPLLSVLCTQTWCLGAQQNSELPLCAISGSLVSGLLCYLLQGGE